MDAKPHKPLRPLRVFADENAVPNGPTNKALHRNKSSPALSTLAATGPNRAFPKRAAFGDVSNTYQVNRRVAKDDLVLPGKGFDAVSKGKVTALAPLKEDEKTGGAFLRPAQRPLKDGLLSKSIIPTKPAVTVPTLPPQEILPQNELSNILANAKQSSDEASTSSEKGHTALDSCLSGILKESQGAGELGFKTDLQNLNITSPVAPAVKEAKLVTLVTESELPIDPALTCELPAVSTNCLNGPERSIPQLKDEHVAPPITEICGDWINIGSELPRDATKVPACPPVSALESTYESLTSAQPIKEASQSYDEDAALTQTALLGNEPEEYWEDEEENYDDEGYVTARSGHSRADNMTKNATTTLVPQSDISAEHEIKAARILVESLRTAEDWEDDFADTTMVAEYSDEIFEYLHQMEAKMQPNPHYMDFQTEIQWTMRGILMDWIVQVHQRFALLPETLFLCTNYIDRFLSAKIVSLNKLQLVGATALFVASKYEEITCPSVAEIVYMVDNGYTLDEILKAERFMLSMLQYELGWPGPMSFLRRISKADDYDLETRTLAKYLLEVTIMDERFLGCPPSFTAAGAHCFARQLLRKGNWSPAHVYYSNYTYSQLLPLVQLLHECCLDPIKHHAAVYDKYQDKRYKYASRYVKQEIQKGFHVPDVRSESGIPVLGYLEGSPWSPSFYGVPWA